MKNKDDIIHQFNVYCKMVLRREKIDYYRELDEKWEHRSFKEQEVLRNALKNRRFCGSINVEK